MQNNYDTLLHRYAKISEKYAAARKLYEPQLAPRFSALYDFFELPELLLSKLIGWLLSPQGTHGQNTLFLESFLRNFLPELDREGIDLATAIIGIEVPAHSQARSIRKVDILIDIPGYASIAIENKPYASWQKNQCRDYLAFASGRESIAALIAFIGWSQDPQTELNKHFGAPEDSRAHGFSYGDIADWLQSIRGSVQAPRVAAFIQQIEEFIGQKFGGRVRETTEMNEQFDAILDSPETIAAALHLIQSRDSLARAIAARFTKILAAKLSRAGFHISSNDLDTLRADSELVVDLGSSTIRFSIQADNNGFRKLSCGLQVTKPQKGLSKRYATLIAAISEAGLPPIRETQPNEWWPWWCYLSDLLEPAVGSDLDEHSRVLMSLIDAGHDGLPEKLLNAAILLARLVAENEPS